MDEQTTINQLKKQVADFCSEREWDPFHSAKDLAIGAVTEAAELLEPFRFQSDKQVEAMMVDETQRQAIAEEMSDVFFFILRMAERYNFDLSESFQNKMSKNALKYPAETFRGQNHKAEDSSKA